MSEDVGTERTPGASASPSFPVARRALIKLLHLAHRLRGFDRYDQFIVEHVHGIPILVTPSVFNPKRMRTGGFFAAQLDSSRIGPNAEVLDMGTGSGVCAVFAARHARRVVAVDINASAVRCARINTLLNRADDTVDVRHGDLFDPVAGERFDLVLFNPPFLTGEARNDRDRAWRANGLGERFAAGLDRHLKPGGAALLLLSTFGDERVFLEPLRRGGHDISPLAQRQYFAERLTLYCVTAGDTAGAT
ncbi:MAG TPA: methyltransferase [Steroidobacteraceae bacterium]|nr:methyltransferase [Steroidobacteraceae bacterium]